MIDGATVDRGASRNSTSKNEGVASLVTGDVRTADRTNRSDEIFIAATTNCGTLGGFRQVDGVGATVALDERGGEGADRNRVTTIRAVVTAKSATVDGRTLDGATGVQVDGVVGKAANERGARKGAIGVLVGDGVVVSSQINLTTVEIGSGVEGVVTCATEDGAAGVCTWLGNEVVTFAEVDNINAVRASNGVVTGFKNERIITGRIAGKDAVGSVSAENDVVISHQTEELMWWVGDLIPHYRTHQRGRRAPSERERSIYTRIDDRAPSVLGELCASPEVALTQKGAPPGGAIRNTILRGDGLCTC